MNDRIVYGFGSMFPVLGAFVVGGVIHQVFVDGSLAITSPVAVFGTLTGVVLIEIGRRAKSRHQEVHDSTDEAENEEDTFDEEVAPFDESDLEKYERNDL